MWVPFAALLLAFCAFAAQAEDFRDYRHYPDESPDNFEYRLNMEDLLPGSAVIFKQGHRLLWEATDVGAATLKNGKIAAVEQNGMIVTVDDRCGGLLSPENIETLSVAGDFLVASAGDKNYFYYLPGCAELRVSERKGHMTAISGKLVCEAGAHSRRVSDLFTGAGLYEDEVPDTILAVYAAQSGCYFLDSAGNVDKYSYDSLSVATNAGGKISAASSYDGGFTGFLEDSYFKMNISSVGTLIEYEYLAGKEDCYLAADSSGVLCEADYEGLASELGAAEKLMLGGESLYILSGESLRAYSRQTVWVKELLISYPAVSVYEKDGDVYITGLLGEVSAFVEEEPVLLEKIPQDAARAGIYEDGAVYDRFGRYIGRYAERIYFDGIRAIYRHESEERVIFFSAAE